MYGNTHTTISKNTSHKIEQNSSCILVILNQARTSHRLVHAWFLRIAFVRELQYVCVCVCVCPPPRLLITSDVMWRDIDHIQLVE